MASKFFRPFGELFDRIVCIAFAILFAQLPVYINQYIDVLSGALTEARILYSDVEQQAGQMGMSVDDFIRHHLDNADEVFIKSGEVYSRAVTRYQAYDEAFTALTSASVWTRPFVFLSKQDPELRKAVVFDAGLPLNLEGAIYALAGLLVALLILGIVRRLFRKRSASPKN
jgi:hypothetical protein